MDIKDELKEVFKKHGIDKGEDILREVVKDLFDLSTKYAMESDKDMVKMIGAMLPMVKKPLVDFIDGLDGEKEEA